MSAIVANPAAWGVSRFGAFPEQRGEIKANLPKHGVVSPSASAMGVYRADWPAHIGRGCGPMASRAKAS